MALCKVCTEQLTVGFTDGLQFPQKLPSGRVHDKEYLRIPATSSFPVTENMRARPSGVHTVGEVRAVTRQSLLSTSCPARPCIPPSTGVLWPLDLPHPLPGSG